MTILEASKSQVKTLQNHDVIRLIENNTEMSETYPFNSEETDGMSKRAQLEEYFSQSLEVDLLLRLCPDDEDIIYQIVDLLVDTCATNRKMLRHCRGR